MDAATSGSCKCYAPKVPSPAVRRATYQDVLDAPPNTIAELIGGELRVQPRPAQGHAAVSSALGEELGPPFKRGRGGPGGWIILDEPEVHLGEDVLVPDLAGWRRSRLPGVAAGQPYIELAPDWVAEIMSPSTAKYDRTDKLGIYHRSRVGWVWLLDPIQRTLEVLRAANLGWTLVASWRDDVRIRAEPFDAIELDLSVLWADILAVGDAE